AREELEETHTLFHAPSLNPHSQHLLFAAVVCPCMEREPCPPLRAVDAPAGKDARDGDDVLLGVAAIHAKRVQLEQLAGVVPVDPGPHPLTPSPSGEGERWGRSGSNT